MKNDFSFVFLPYLIIYRKEELMIYTKPKILAQSNVQMADCRPNPRPSGRPCNPPGPRGGK
jgi:hypothetical protein